MVESGKGKLWCCKSRGCLPRCTMRAVMWWALSVLVDTCAHACNLHHAGDCCCAAVAAITKPQTLVLLHLAVQPSPCLPHCMSSVVASGTFSHSHINPTTGFTQDRAQGRRCRSQLPERCFLNPQLTGHGAYRRWPSCTEWDNFSKVTNPQNLSAQIPGSTGSPLCTLTLHAVGVVWPI